MVINMNTFLDTNVIIGYIFSLDDLNDSAELLVFNSDRIHYSENVQNEVNEVFTRKKFEFETFFSILELELKKFDDFEFLISSQLYESIGKFNDIQGMNSKDMQNSFGKLWENFNFSENQEVFSIKLKLNDFIQNFEGFHILRKINIFNKLVFVSSHTKKDKNILDKIKKENLKEYLHDNDEDILFDANEYCRNNPWLNLKFVSADKDFIKSIKILRDELCINECVDLLEFSPNS